MNGYQRHLRFSFSLASNFLSYLGFSFIATLILLISGCGQGETDNNSISANGSLIIGLTDAEGDFVNYAVDVKSITLTRSNGEVVNVLPVSTRVDFAQYTELTEFVTASMVPLGAYKQVVLTLDYSNADIRVENSTGEAVQVVDIQDGDGNPVTSLDLTVHLEGRNKLVISRGVPSHLTLDFDLNASNKAVFDSDGIPATVVVEPYLLADVDLQRPKSYRLRGALQEVDTENSSFEIMIQPFHHKSMNNKLFGNLTVLTDDETIYDIDNQSYTGTPGLVVLGALPQFTTTIVHGKFKFNPTRFIASEVYAGESVPGGALDVVRGNVLAREGNSLVVSGVTLIRSGGIVTFNNNVTVTIADTTMVKKQLSTDSHSIGEISVGQKVSIFGTITNDDPESMQMDAVNGVVRLKITKVTGTSADDNTNALSTYYVMNAQAFNHKPVALFDFTGTGIDSDHDANPESYEVDSGMLPVDEITGLTPVQVYGFVTPFSTAPADFTATRIVDLTRLPAILTMNWTPDTANPFSEVTDNSFTLNLQDRGVFHHVGRGGAIVDLSSLSPAPVIRAADNGGWYVLKEKGPRLVFTDFKNFMDEIQLRMAHGSAMKRIVAQGYFNDVTTTLVADDVYVKLK